MEAIHCSALVFSLVGRDGSRCFRIFIEDSRVWALSKHCNRMFCYQVCDNNGAMWLPLNLMGFSLTTYDVLGKGKSDVGSFGKMEKGFSYYPLHNLEKLLALKGDTHKDRIALRLCQTVRALHLVSDVSIAVDVRLLFVKLLQREVFVLEDTINAKDTNLSNEDGTFASSTALVLTDDFIKKGVMDVLQGDWVMLADLFAKDKPSICSPNDVVGSVKILESTLLFVTVLWRPVALEMNLSILGMVPKEGSLLKDDYPYQLCFLVNSDGIGYTCLHWAVFFLLYEKCRNLTWHMFDEKSQQKSFPLGRMSVRLCFEASLWYFPSEDDVRLSWSMDKWESDYNGFSKIMIGLWFSMADFIHVRCVGSGSDILHLLRSSVSSGLMSDKRRLLLVFGFKCGKMRPVKGKVLSNGEGTVVKLPFSGGYNVLGSVNEARHLFGVMTARGEKSGKQGIVQNVVGSFVHASGHVLWHKDSGIESASDFDVGINDNACWAVANFAASVYDVTVPYLLGVIIDCAGYKMGPLYKVFDSKTLFEVNVFVNKVRYTVVERQLHYKRCRICWVSTFGLPQQWDGAADPFVDASGHDKSAPGFGCAGYLKFKASNFELLMVSFELNADDTTYSTQIVESKRKRLLWLLSCHAARCMVIGFDEACKHYCDVYYRLIIPNVLEMAAALKKQRFIVLLWKHFERYVPVHLCTEQFMDFNSRGFRIGMIEGKGREAKWILMMRYWVPLYCYANREGPVFSIKIVDNVLETGLVLYQGRNIGFGISYMGSFNQLGAGSPSNKKLAGEVLFWRPSHMLRREVFWDEMRMLKWVFDSRPWKKVYLVAPFSARTGSKPRLLEAPD